MTDFLLPVPLFKTLLSFWRKVERGAIGHRALGLVQDNLELIEDDSPPSPKNKPLVFPSETRSIDCILCHPSSAFPLSVLTLRLPCVPGR